MSSSQQQQQQQSAVLRMFLDGGEQSSDPIVLVVRVVPLPSSASNRGHIRIISDCCSTTTNNNDDNNSSSNNNNNNNTAIVQLIGSARTYLSCNDDIVFPKTAVRGYVTSQTNAGITTAQPLLFLAKVDVTSDEVLPQQVSQQQLQQELRTALKFHLPHHGSTSRIPGGLSYQFFSKIAPLLSDDDLAGTKRQNLTTTSPTITQDWQAKEDLVTHFLQHNKTVQTIHNNTTTTTGVNNIPTAAAAAATANANSSSQQQPPQQQPLFTDVVHRTSTETYIRTLQDFQGAQYDRQTASLTSHTGRETANMASKIAAQYRTTLRHAIRHATTRHGGNTSTNTTAYEPLTPQLLCRWHGELCKDLIPTAGKIRPSNVQVRVGQTSFRPSSVVQHDLHVLCQSLQLLEQRLLWNNNSSSGGSSINHHQSQQQSQPQSSCIPVLTYAAAVFFGVVDTHAFADGNGRLARIAANWALARAGLPFCISLLSSPQQRQECTAATLQTRRALTLVARGDVSSDALLQAYVMGECLFPLVDLLLDRTSKTVTEFGKLVQENMPNPESNEEEDQARAARLFRERAARGSCLICFDGNPNIATLCCGKAVHLNCMAEWLSSRGSLGSCPQCRADLPSLPRRMQRSNINDHRIAALGDLLDALNGDGDNSDNNSRSSNNDDTTTDETTTTVSASDDTTADDDDVATAEAAAAAAAAAAAQAVEDTTTSIQGSSDDDTTTIAVAVPNHNMANDDNDTTTAFTDDDDDDDNNDANTALVEYGGGVDSGDDDTTTVQVSNNNNVQQPYCDYGRCHNRAAQDCSNDYCGRCCILHGWRSCERHNT